MASAFTHAYVALPLIGVAGPSLSRGQLACLLVSASILPDLDVLGFAMGIDYGHPLGHRGLSHSLVFAVAVAALVVLALRSRAPMTPTAQWRLFAAITLSCASHGVLDAFTDAGLGIGFLIPFSSERFFFPWRPISTSPLHPRAFFSAQGLEILAVEIRWVWLPVTVAWLGGTLTTRVLRQPIER